MAQQTPSLTEIVARISQAATSIDTYLKTNNIQHPTFAQDTPPGLPHVPEVMLAKMELLEQLSDLQALIQGPAEFLSIGVLQKNHDQSVINVLNQFNFWDAVPLNSSISYADLAKKVGLNVSVVQRILRYAQTRRIFAETAPGSKQIQHTSISAMPVHNPLIRSWIGHNLEDFWPSAQFLPAALRKWNDDDSGDASHCAANLAFYKNDENKTIWDFFTEDEAPERGLPKGYRDKRFGEAMTAATADPSFNLNSVHALYEWDALPNNATMVDIGGSAGHVCVEIAKNHHNLTFIVQDRPILESNFNTTVPADLKSRIKFQPYDFFTPQTVQGADVYFLKHILHDWSDPWAAKILRQVVPAMTSSSKVLIMDGVMPDPGTAPRTVEGVMGALDLQMLVGLNGKERTVDDWKSLCKLADDRLVVRSIRAPPGIAFAIIEVELNG